MSVAERSASEKNMIRLYNNLTGYTSAVQKEAAEQDKKLTSSIIAQINSFVQDYAKRKGYDLVLGAEGTGSIYYGSKSMDITNDVLAAMNKDYKLVGDKQNVQ
jgi:outer membrane protein